MNRALLLGVFLVGVVLGAAGVGLLVPAETTVGTDGDPPYSYTASTRPAGEDLDSAGGWMHEVSIEDHVVVTGNATVVHDSDRDLELGITQRASGVYEFAFVTGPAESESKDPDGTVATTIDWGVSLPLDYESYVVTVDGTTVRRVENDEATTARLLDLPQPLS